MAGKRRRGDVFEGGGVDTSMHTIITALVSLKNWLLIKDTFEKEKTAFKGESLNQSLPL